MAQAALKVNMPTCPTTSVRARIKVSFGSSVDRGTGRRTDSSKLGDHLADTTRESGGGKTDVGSHGAEEEGLQNDGRSRQSLPTGAGIGEDGTYDEPLARVGPVKGVLGVTLLEFDEEDLAPVKVFAVVLLLALAALLHVLTGGMVLVGERKRVSSAFEFIANVRE